MIRHTLKILQQMLQGFWSLSYHFGTLCIKGLKLLNQSKRSLTLNPVFHMNASHICTGLYKKVVFFTKKTTILPQKLLCLVLKIFAVKKDKNQWKVKIHPDWNVSENLTFYIVISVMTLWLYPWRYTVIRQVAWNAIDENTKDRCHQQTDNN